MPNSVWYLSFSKKKIEFKKYSVKQKNKKPVKKTKQKSITIPKEAKKIKKGDHVLITKLK